MSNHPTADREGDSKVDQGAACPSQDLGDPEISQAPEVIEIAGILSKPSVQKRGIDIKWEPGDHMRVEAYLDLSVGGMYVRLEPAGWSSVKEALLDWAVWQGGPAVPYVEALAKRLNEVPDYELLAGPNDFLFRVAAVLRRLLGDMDRLEAVWEEWSAIASCLDADHQTKVLVAKLVNNSSEADETLVQEILKDWLIRKMRES